MANDMAGQGLRSKLCDAYAIQCKQSIPARQVGTEGLSEAYCACIKLWHSCAQMREMF